MLGYEDFKKELKDSVVKKGAGEISVLDHRIAKNNCECDGMLVGWNSNSELSVRCKATWYYESLYDDYVHGKSIDSLTDMIIKGSDKDYAKRIQEYDGDWLQKNYADYVQICLLGRAGNENYVEQLVTKDFLDLVICFSIAFQNEYVGTANIMVTKQLAERLNLDYDALWSAAFKKGYTIGKMSDILKESGIYLNEIPDEPSFYVISNETGNHGAGALLCEGALEALARNFSKDFYLLPSSIHEWIAIESDFDKQTIKNFKEMVTEINASEVAITDKLSDSVYYCNKETLEIVML